MASKHPPELAAPAPAGRQQRTHAPKEQPRARTARLQRTGVLVLGMHRSGTSALARVLNLLGCDLPKTPLEATGSNEAGHWESRAIIAFNDELLASAGTSWDDWLEFNPRWARSPKARTFRQRAEEVLREEFEDSPFFVLKDPRICRFPQFWLKALQGVGAKPVVVLPIRNPVEVAASLEARNGFSRAFGQLLWLRHVIDAEHGSRGLPRWFTSYDQLIGSAAGGMIGAAEDALDLSWPALSRTRSPGSTPF